MPVTPTYPGVYIEEIPSGVRTIVGVATSITAFIGRGKRGPTNEAKTINSLSDFDRIFGGLWLESALGYAVRDFYLNGGSQAIVVRLFHPIFNSEDERQKAETAAKAVADEAKAAADGKAAKEAANAKQKDIDDDADKTPVEKQTAKEVAALIGKVADDATKEDVAKVADAAVIKASSLNKAKLSVGDIKLVAAYEGAWGANLRARVDVDDITDPNLFNLTAVDAGTGGSSERFLNLSVANDSPRRIDKVLEAESKLVKWDGQWPPATLPDLAKIKKSIEDLAKATDEDKPAKQDALWPLTLDAVTQAESVYARAKAAREKAENTGMTGKPLTDAKTAETQAKTALETAKQTMVDSVSDGLELTINDFLPTNSKKEKKGMHALEQADLFNLLCIPPYKDGNVERNLLSAAAAYCEERRAMLIVDPHSSWNSKDKARDEFRKADDNYPGIPNKNAALFFPRLKQPNPLRGNQIEEFVPCGALAGIFARTDVQRGVWKAPAGMEATLVGVPQLSVNLTDAENGELNPLGINCLRAFPVIGRVVWGARTLRGADQLADEWKYIPVRRTALFIEESLYRGTQWVVFEPNDEPLWAQIRLNVGAFMHNLFRQGAFQGTTPREAYFVKCDKETTTQNDINMGIVNIVVGFAPLKPAEFVIIKLQQMAGQIEV